MKKRAFAVLTVLYGGLFESFIYGLYGYQILTFFFMALIITVCADIITLHRNTYKAVSKIQVSRKISREEMKKVIAVKMKNSLN